MPSLLQPETSSSCKCDVEKGRVCRRGGCGLGVAACHLYNEATEEKIWEGNLAEIRSFTRLRAWEDLHVRLHRDAPGLSLSASAPL